MSYIGRFLIWIYQKLISPLKPATCRYYPTCSHYAAEALKKHGFILGSLLAISRVLRCNPWSRGGVDYVPDRFRDGFFKKNPHKPEN